MVVCNVQISIPFLIYLYNDNNNNNYNYNMFEKNTCKREKIRYIYTNTGISVGMVQKNICRGRVKLKPQTMIHFLFVLIGQ